MFDKRSHPLVPPYIRDLTSYKAGKTIEEVKNLYNPPRISKLASNENRLGCSRRVKPAVEKALQSIQDYPDPVAHKLRTQIADRNNVSPDNVILAAGSESLIANICRTFFLEDEEAITAEVTFVGFFVHANVENVSIEKVALTDGYRYDLPSLADAMTNQTKLVYIANPNNPTGTYITKSEFELFMRKVPADVLVIMDEAYFEYAQSIKDYPRALDYSYDNVLTLRTFSKAYGLAGFRVGYGIGHQNLIDMMMKTKMTFEPTSMAQEVALAAYNDTGFIEESRSVVEKGKRRIYSLLDTYDIDYVPSVSNSVLMILPNEQVAQEFNQKMLEKGVILRRTNAFGLPNGIRITIGTKREIDHFERSLHQVSDQILAGNKE